jgi:hypothetical protein
METSALLVHGGGAKGRVVGVLYVLRCLREVLDNGNNGGLCGKSLRVEGRMK